MASKKSIIYTNFSLLLLVILSGVVAAYLYRLPNPHKEHTGNVVSIPDSTAYTDARLISYPDSIKDFHTPSATEGDPEHSSSTQSASDTYRTVTFADTDPAIMTANHPFAKEAGKLLSGNLNLEDSISRRKILNYCEHFRTAYTTRDIDFIRQVMSDNALIIVGHTVKSAEANHSLSASPAVRYSVRTKKQYLENLTKIFAANKKISVDFTDFRILRHPTMDGIYGVTLRQKYASDKYADEGYLFLLWDFRNPSMPQIHVRTWQPTASLTDEDEIFGLEDFNLQ